MKPINAAQRRGQFFRFVLLFLLAMTPVVVFMYLMGRTEAKAYEELLSERNACVDQQNLSKEHGALVAELFRKGSSVELDMNSGERDLLNFKDKADGDLRNSLSFLMDAAEDLSNDKSGGEADQKLVKFARNYANSCRVLLDVYVQAQSMIKQSDADLTTCQTNLTKRENDLTKCQGELGNRGMVGGN